MSGVDGTAVKDRAQEMLRGFLRRRGLALVGYTPGDYVHRQRAEILKSHGVDLALDVGANVGQHVRNLRIEGYTRRIVSFEPHSEAFAQLTATAEGDPNWEVERLALGDEEGEITLHVSEDSVYNSVLDRSDWVPEYVGSEIVSTARLDSLRGRIWKPEDRIYLKVDVQGYELAVLRGASDLLKHASIVEVELSLSEYYTAEHLAPEVLLELYRAGFVLVSFRPTDVDAQTGYLRQADGILVREVPMTPGQPG
jgi:FkbM family methyltransferase